MIIKWIKTAHKGLRYYEHTTRKHGKRWDRYYAVRFKVDGKDYGYGIGWWSDGIPEKALLNDPGMGFEDYCLSQLKLYKANVKAGSGVKSPKEKRQLAKEEEAQKVAEQERQIQEAITISEYCEKTYFPWTKNNKADNTYRTENLLFTRWIKPVIGTIPLIEVVQTDIESVKQAMFTAKKAPKTVHHTLGLIRQIFNHAKRPDIYLRAKVKMPKIDNAKLRYLTPVEIDKLLTALKKKSVIVYDQAILAINCGLRFSEAAGLRWEDVNYDTGSLSIRDSKTGSRTVFLNDVVADMLKNRQEEKTTGLVFPAKRKEGKDNDQIQLRASKTFQRVADKLFNTDVNDRRLRVTFHTLRHSFGTHIYENSGDLYLTQKALGHRTMVMATRYAKMSETKLREAFAIMSNVMKSGKEKAEDIEQVVNLTK